MPYLLARMLEAAAYYAQLLRAEVRSWFGGTPAEGLLVAALAVETTFLLEVLRTL